MKEMLILNGVATYKHAPVPIEVLTSNMTQIFNKIQSEKANRYLLLIEQEDEKIAEQIERTVKNYHDFDLEIVSVEPQYRLLYNNESAVMNLLNGVNPLPKSKESHHILKNIESYLDTEKKQVYIVVNSMKTSVYEVNKTTTPRSIIELTEINESAKGIYFGYPMGRLLGIDEWDKSLEVTTDYVHIFTNEDCILHELMHIMESYEEASCGRCVFGYEGITQICLTLDEISNKKGKVDDLKKLEKLALQMQQQTLCEVGEAISSILRDALNFFYEEIEAHLTQKLCPAMVCEKFMTYHVLASKCTGCMECLDACKDEAILGKEKFVHVIDQKECTSCGACITSCPEEAIVRAGAVKPKCPPKPIPCIKR